ncbi:CLUMA_CG016874, isoform A [Clunio marinus]|uniref:CLUMA_CG016874, isoform A n=1 Tax=Clunio marinus TaxID=568069 RepID=A0A1J1IXF1_9DIPT|nr:CLUMA_CG016874, isoform A [Clunio marinus]
MSTNRMKEKLGIEWKGISHHSTNKEKRTAQVLYVKYDNHFVFFTPNKLRHLKTKRKKTGKVSGDEQTKTAKKLNWDLIFLLHLRFAR